VWTKPGPGPMGYPMGYLMGYPMGCPVGHPPIFFLIKIKNSKHKKNKLKTNFLLIYQLLIF